VIPEIDIWRVANLMLTRYGDEAVAEGAKRAEDLVIQTRFKNNLLFGTAAGPCHEP
jgi:hypothetical protein